MWAAVTLSEIRTGLSTTFIAAGAGIDHRFSSSDVWHFLGSLVVWLGRVVPIMNIPVNL